MILERKKDPKNTEGINITKKRKNGGKREIKRKRRKTKFKVKNVKMHKKLYKTLREGNK